MSQKKVAIYTTPTCPYCKMAKAYLKKKNIPYVEHNVAEDKEALKEMIKKSGQMGVPVILVDDEVITGFNQVELDRLLAK